MKKPVISVVTANYQRKDTLRMCLDRLARQTLPADEFEVVVVDDGSADGTVEMMRTFPKSLPYRLRFFEQHHLGPGAAHNRGVREARADLILFLANDMLASPVLLESHLKTHALHPQPNVAVVGRLAESREVLQTAFQKAWDPYAGREMDGKQELDELDFWVSNLSMKRGFFLDSGVFLEFPGPAMEDHELAHRLFRNGLKLIYCREALAHHYHPQTVETALARVYETGKNFAQYEDWVPDETKVHEFAHVLSSRLNPKSYFKILARDILRLGFFNGMTVPWVVVPLIKKAETSKILEPYVFFMTRRACGYYFRKGVRDGRRSRRGQ